MENNQARKVHVSVITVCRNAGEAIRETVESVLNQNFDSFEYIVKDGKSTDNTLQILQEYIPEFKKRDIKYVLISEVDNSLYEAMNIGIEISSGHWLNFMNAGDSFYNTHVLDNVFKQNYDDAVVLYGDNIVEDEFGIGLNIADINVIHKKMPFNHQAAFFNAMYIKQYMYDEKYKIGADYDLVIRLYMAGYKFIHLDEIVSKYRLNGMSSTEYVKVARERQLIRNTYGYRDNVWLENWKIIEAYIKEILEKYCPRYILKYLNRFYKIHVKKYNLEI